MRCDLAVFNNDQVNLDLMRCPASELMKAEEYHQRECQPRGLRPGMPVNMQHDMHRLVGWTRPIGLYADSQMVRVMGLVEQPDSEQEKADLLARAEEYWRHHHYDGTALFRDDLVARAAPASLSDACFLYLEAAVVKRAGIAAELYPDLYAPGGASVDRDGLTNYRRLLDRVKELQPGVFHDSGRNLLLFAHSFFRRSLSHRNKLNSYFLQSFVAKANKNCNLEVRLRLDPDIVGHPDSLQDSIELEYWRGPMYSDDIASIPNGVTEHKADERSRKFEGIDRTHVWWKSPESRQVGGGEVVEYRTFEVEELIENPSEGLGEHQFGCRYAHAEFSVAEAAITHFDGAIRAYLGERYLDRIELSIDRAGKQAAYTKLFRFDGALAIPHWKRLLSDYFRGNKLILEYLGASAEVVTARSKDIADQPLSEADCSTLVALVSLDRGTIEDPVQICTEHSVEVDGLLVPYVEAGAGEVAHFVAAHFDVEGSTMVDFGDGVLNLSRIRFGTSYDVKQKLYAVLSALSEALCRDVGAGIIRQAAIPLVWENDGLLITLTVAGDADKVAALLGELQNIVDPTKLPSEWIEQLSDIIKVRAPRQKSAVNWSGVSRGILAYQRSADIRPSLLMQEGTKTRSSEG